MTEITVDDAIIPVYAIDDRIEVMAADLSRPCYAIDSAFLVNLYSRLQYILTEDEVRMLQENGSRIGLAGVGMPNAKTTTVYV
jgi:hypothetical protein